MKGENDAKKRQKAFFWQQEKTVRSWGRLTYMRSRIYRKCIERKKKKETSIERKIREEGEGQT